MLFIGCTLYMRARFYHCKNKISNFIIIINSFSHFVIRSFYTSIGLILVEV